MINIKDKTYDVVILIHEANEEILESLKALTLQSIKPQKIVIYNTMLGGTHDSRDKEELLKKASDIVKNTNIDIEIVNIEEIAFDHGKARNDASKLCESNYILFLTDDAIPYDENLANNLLKAYDNDYIEETDDLKVAVSYARQLAKSTARNKERIVREFNYPNYDIVKEKSREKELGIKNYYCSNVCAMYDREIFERLGRFEEGIILNEDTFYVYNAINKGYKVVYKSDAKVLHSHNLSYIQQFNRNFDIGVSQKERHEIFDNIHSEKEGTKLLRYAIGKFLKKGDIIGIVDFTIECAYRYFGYKKGYNFEKLTTDTCIKYACNKNYFRKKK